MTLKCIFRIPLCFWLSRESVWHLGRATINAKFQAPTHWKVTHSVWPGRVFVRESKPFLFLKISSVCLCMSPGSGLAWSAEVGGGMHSYLLPQLSRSYKHVLFRLLSRRCISTFRDRAMQHTLTPAIYLTVQTDRVKLYLEHRSAWNILFTDEHEHLNILIIFLSAQVIFTPALSDEKVHWKQDKEQFLSTWKVCEGCHFWQKS